MTPSLLRSGSFGKLFYRIVQGQPYVQPLYVHGLAFPDGTHNVVFTATEENMVYAFDADHPMQMQPLWQTWLGPSWKIDTGCGDLLPKVGITGTPVIDAATNTMYVIAKTDGGGPRCPYIIHHNISHQLHAIDLVTGRDKMPPQTICGIVPGYSDNAVFSIYFDSRRAHQRAALLLDHGVIYAAFGSHCDQDPYWGWVFAFDAKTLRPLAVPFITTPRGVRGSLWQAGGGLAADGDGNVYGMSGNGDVDLAHTPPNVSMSFLKLRSDQGVVALQSYYTVPNHAVLNHNDWDLGSSGPLLMQLPNRTVVTGGGKDGQVYVVDTSSMQALQSFNATPADIGHNHIHGSPVFWDGPDGRLVYFCPEVEDLHAYRFDIDGAVYDWQHPIYSNVLCSPKMPGGFMSISANGSQDGIIWFNHPVDAEGDDNGDGATGGLTALDARTLQTLWESNTRPENAIGSYAKFTTPTIADGKVFVHSFGAWDQGPPDSGYLNVFGVTCQPACEKGECVDGQCQGCTPQEIANNCDGECGIPNGCGGTCNCPRGKTCLHNIPITSPRQQRDIDLPPGGGGGGGGRGGVCVASTARECTPRTIEANCAGKCNVSNGCGGTCQCATGSCNPQTDTCCDWQTECQKAGPCHVVCSNVTCPCGGDAVCTTDHTCCSPSCPTDAECGQSDGCGGLCFGGCAADELCVDDGLTRTCHPRIGPCNKDPRYCDISNAALVTECRKDANQCWVNLTHGHSHGHASGSNGPMNMKSAKPANEKPPLRR